MANIDKGKNSDSVRYKNNSLFVEKVSVKRLASKYGSPFYLYSNSDIVENYRSFYNKFKKVNPLICLSVKANSNVQVLRILKNMGSGADVVSGGELLKALKAKNQSFGGELASMVHFIKRRIL